MKRNGTFWVFVVLGLCCGISSGEWVLDGTLPSNVAYQGAAVLDNDGIVVFGGFNGANTVSSAYLYHPGGAIDQTTADMPDSGRHNMGYVKHQGTIYSIAGYNEKYAPGGNWGRTTNVWGYNAASNSWSTQTSLSYARADSSAASFGNDIYIIGGHHEDTGHGFSLSMVEKYNPSQGGAWQSVASLNYDREGLGAVAADGRVYAIGGLAYDAYTTPHLWEGRMEVYDPATNTWTEGLSMPTPRSHFGITVMGDKIYTIGGWTNFTYSNVVEYYDISEGQWFTGESLPIGLRGGVALTMGNEIYLLGGQGSDGYVNSVYTIPEPASLLLLGLGGLAMIRKRK